MDVTYDAAADDDDSNGTTLYHSGYPLRLYTFNKTICFELSCIYTIKMIGLIDLVRYQFFLHSLANEMVVSVQLH